MFPKQAHADENFCPECQAAWDEQPLGALVRRWTAEAADGNGRQSGLVCDKCKGIVRKRGARAALGSLNFHFVNPQTACASARAWSSACASACASARGSPAGATAAFGRLSGEEQDARRAAHDQEVRERQSWCLQRGLTPAHEHVHRAPGCDANFMFGEPPWKADGSVNPRGVPFCYAADMILEKERQLEDYDARGFACRKCGAIVRIAAREFQGGPEPVDWWWCKACKESGADGSGGKTVKEKRAAQAAAGCMRLEAVWPGRS
jgi:hypothetical protein